MEFGSSKHIIPNVLRYTTQEFEFCRAITHDSHTQHCMKQAAISSFFKRSATASDDILLPSRKKIKSDEPASKPITPSALKSEERKNKIDIIKEEDEEVATPPIPHAPPSPNFSDDEGGDTEEDEELQEQGTSRNLSLFYFFFCAKNSNSKN